MDVTVSLCTCSLAGRFAPSFCNRLDSNLLITTHLSLPVSPQPLPLQLQLVRLYIAPKERPNEFYDSVRDFSWNDLTNDTTVRTLKVRIVEKKIIDSLELYNIKLENAGPYNANNNSIPQISPNLLELNEPNQTLADLADHLILVSTQGESKQFIL